MTTVKYILLTIENRTVRVALGVQPGHAPITYWMEKGDIYSYVFFQGCMTEKEGGQILAAAEADNYGSAIRLFRKYFRGENSDTMYIEAEGMKGWDGKTLYLPISEVVPDDWFDECKQIMSLMRTNIRDVLTFERNEEEW